MHYRQSIDAALNLAIGDAGVDPAALQSLLSGIPAIADTLQQRATNGELAFLTEPARSDDLALIEHWADHIRDGFAHLVVLGTGGSSLGGMALASLRAPRFLPAGTSLHFIDNSDPDTLQQALEQLPLADTFFLVVSKSGSTTETLAQWMLVLQAMRTAGLSAKDQCLVLTLPQDNPLRRLAEAWAVPLLDHDPAIGGRFSVLSVVGLLPAAVAGLDIRALRSGAEEVMQQCWRDPAASPAAIGAALLVAAMRQGRNINILLPYGDRLRLLGRWYRQLWAESIGKNGQGSTPVCALGAVDQHSQLQLWLDGPRDRLITFIACESAETGAAISPQTAAQAGMEWLGGHSLGDIIAAQWRATAETLTRHKVAQRQLVLDDMSESSVGALLQHFMLETAFAAGLSGVDAFDQPAVEEGKQLTRDLLSG